MAFHVPVDPRQACQPLSATHGMGYIELCGFGNAMARLIDDERRLSRRKFLRRLASTTAVVGGSALAARFARAQDTQLQSLIEQNQRDGEFGQSFDSASRTITMPKAGLPTLSPLSVLTTEQAIRRYEAIVAGGGWPMVPAGERMRLGNRQPAVITLAPAPGGGGRSRREYRGFRHLRFLRRGRGAAVPGAPRIVGRRPHARDRPTPR